MASSVSIGARGSGDHVESGHVSPKPLKVVVISSLFGEDVDDEEAVVHQHPAEGISAFDAVWLRPSGFRQCLFHPIHDGSDLTSVAAGGHDKPVGDGKDPTHIEGIGPLAELVLRRLACGAYPGNQFLVFYRYVLWRLVG